MSLGICVTSAECYYFPLLVGFNSVRSPIRRVLSKKNIKNKKERKEKTKKSERKRAREKERKEKKTTS